MEVHAKTCTLVWRFWREFQLGNTEMSVVQKWLMLATAFKLAQSMAAAETNVTKLKNVEASAPINRTETAKLTVKKTCYRCGCHSHAPGDCQFSEYTCNKCKKKGHLAKVSESRIAKFTSTKKDGSLLRPALNINLEIPNNIAKLRLYESQLLRTQ